MTANPFAPIPTPHDEDLYSSLNDPYASIPYLRRDQENRLNESLTWGEMFDAAWTGAVTGVGSYAPERFYRALRTVGAAVGSDSLQEWAAQGVEENVRERETDPWYKPDEAWMQKEWGRALYEGFANTTAGLVTMAPGALAVMAAAPAAAGSAIGSLLLMKGATFMGGSLFNGILHGFSEFDSFVDEAYQELSQIDPNVTRDTVRSDKFWQAVVSGLAEGGTGIAQDALIGRLSGILGRETGKQASHLVTRLIRNTYSNAITELGEEAFTAYIQDWAKENAGLSHQGRWEAIQNIIKPTLVAGVLGGGTATAMQSMQSHGIAEFQKVLDDNITRERMARAKEALSPNALNAMNSLVEQGGLDQTAALSTATVVDSLVNRMAQESGQDAASLFQNVDATDPALRSMVDTARDRSASFDRVVDNSIDFLWQRLTPDVQQEIQTQFSDQDGQFQQQALIDQFKTFLRDGDVAGISDTSRLGFEGMRNVLADALFALGDNSRLGVSKEAMDVFQASMGETYQNPAGPAVSRDAQAFKAHLEALPRGELSNEQWSEVKGPLATSTNFDALSGNVPLTAGEAFQQWYKALEPVFDKLKDSQRLRPDEETKARAQQAIDANPQLAEAIQVFEKAYGNDQGFVIMQHILDVAGAKVEQLAAQFEQSQSLENALQFSVMVDQYAMMKAFREGTASEAGRMLRMARMTRSDPRLADKLASSIQALGGTRKIEQLAVVIQNAKNEQEVQVAIDAASKAKTSDMFIEMVTSGMLWGPSTHFVNTLSNGINVFKAVIEKGYAEFMGGQSRGIAPGTTAAYITGIWRGIHRTAEIWRTHRANYDGTGAAIMNSGRMWSNADQGSILADTGTMHRTITRENLLDRIDAGKRWLGLSAEHGRVSEGLAGGVDLLGRFLNIPFTALNHSDQFFKTVVYSAELHSQIHNAAKGDAAVANQLHKRPPADLSRRAAEAAKELTFQSDLGKIGRTVNDLRNQFPLSRLVLPFLKTPINIFKEGASMTPGLNHLVGEFQQKLNSNDPGVRQLAEAKLMVGSIIWTSALVAASSGFLTGPGPEDRDERAKMMATGWRPNSLHIGDKYYQLSRLDPLAAVFNSAAFVTEIVNNVDQEDFGKAMLQGFGQTVRLIADRSYIDSFSEIMKFIMAPEQNGAEFMRRMGGMVVPASALWRTVNRSDPYQREAETFWDAFKQNIPGMSQYLPIRRDFLGQPMKSSDYAGPTWLSPFQVGTRTGDVLYEEINRLHGKGYTAAPMPGRNYTRQGKRLRMDPAEYGAFLDQYGNKTRINGKTLNESLRHLVKSPQYLTMPDDQKSESIRYLTDRYSRQAREEVFGGSSRLRNIFNVKSQGWEYLIGNAIR